MPAVIATADLRTALGQEGATAPAALLDQLIDRAEGAMWGHLRQKLSQATYTAEKYDGNGTPYLTLRAHPITTLTSAAIEGEAAIDQANPAIIRIWKRDLVLVSGRVWTRGLPNNVTVTYQAGYSDLETQLPDVWAALLDGCLILWADAKAQRSGVASQSFLEGSVAYFTPTEGATRRLAQSWQPVIKRHMRRGTTAMIPGPTHHGLGIGWS